MAGSLFPLQEKCLCAGVTVDLKKHFQFGGRLVRSKLVLTSLLFYSGYLSSNFNVYKV